MALKENNNTLLKLLKGHLNSSSNNNFIEDKRNKISIKYKEIIFFIELVEKELVLKGVKNRSRVIIFLDNSWFYVIIYLVAIKMGFTLIPVETSTKTKKILEILKSLKADFILTEEIFKENFSSLRKSLLILFDIKRIAKKKFIKSNYENIEIDLEREYLIVSSSGTSGNQKFIVHSLKTLLNFGLNHNKYHGLNSEVRLYHLWSMAYMAGILNTIFCPFLLGGTIVFDKKFSPSSGMFFWDFIFSNKINVVWLSPTMVNSILILDRCRVTKQQIRKGVQYIFAATSKLADKSFDEFFDKYGVKLIQNYGLSELPLISSNFVSKKNSAGEALPQIQLKIDKSKEVIVKANAPFLGYIDTKINKIVPSKDWFQTGDLGEFIHNKNLNIIGRKKEIIIKGGINISPLEVENEIKAYLKNIEVAVVGVSDYFYGEKICVFSIINKVKKVDLEELCKKVLPNFQIPDYYFFIEKIPYTHNGKVQRFKLKKIAEKKILLIKND